MLLTGSDGVLQLATTTNGNLEILKAEIQTTDATVTTLFSVAVANDSAVHFEINVVAIEVTDHDETASYQRIVTIQNDGGVLSVIGSVSAPHTAEVTASWDIPLALRAPNVLVRVSGAAATIINWYGTIQKYKIA